MIALLACADAESLGDLAWTLRSPPRELSRPNRVAVAPDGTVYVSNFQHDRIVEFAPDHSFRRTFGATGIGLGRLWRVTALTVVADGSLVLVNRRPASAEKGSVENRSELVWFEDGIERDRFDLDVPDNGTVEAIAQTASGALVLATGDGLQEIDGTGALLGTFGPPVEATALTADGDALWVVEQNVHRILHTSRDATDRVLELGPAGPRFPSAVASCEGYLVVTDYGRHRIVRMEHGGRVLRSFAPTPESPDRPVQLMDLRADRACARLYVVDSKGDRVMITDLNGAVLDELWTW